LAQTTINVIPTMLSVDVDKAKAKCARLKENESELNEQYQIECKLVCSASLETNARLKIIDKGTGFLTPSVLADWGVYLTKLENSTRRFELAADIREVRKQIIDADGAIDVLLTIIPDVSPLCYFPVELLVGVFSLVPKSMASIRLVCKQWYDIVRTTYKLDIQRTRFRMEGPSFHFNRIDLTSIMKTKAHMVAIPGGDGNIWIQSHGWVVAINPKNGKFVKKVAIPKGVGTITLHSVSPGGVFLCEKIDGYFNFFVFNGEGNVKKLYIPAWAITILTETTVLVRHEDTVTIYNIDTCTVTDICKFDMVRNVYNTGNGVYVEGTTISYLEYNTLKTTIPPIKAIPTKWFPITGTNAIVTTSKSGDFYVGGIGVMSNSNLTKGCFSPIVCSGLYTVVLIGTDLFIY
jgi:hypothetical protein